MKHETYDGEHGVEPGLTDRCPLCGEVEPVRRILGASSRTRHQRRVIEYKASALGYDRREICEPCREMLDIEERGEVKPMRN